MKKTILLFLIATFVAFMFVFIFACNQPTSTTSTTIPTYTVVYNGNGNTGGSVPTDGNTYQVGDTVTVFDNTGSLVKTNFVFMGWNTAADRSAEDLTADDTFTMGSSNVTLYAQWHIDLSYSETISITGKTYTQTDGSNSFNHTISDFSIGKYEVTYELWYTVYQWAINNGYTFANRGKEGDDGTTGAAPTSVKYEPVTTINWRDAIVWCNAYSEMTGLAPCYTYSGNIIRDSQDSNDTTCDNAVCNWNATGYRLPSEGEWQFTASDKGAIPYNYASGAAADYNDATEDCLVAWYDTNSGSHTHTVGTTTNPSALTLWDLSGNVLEWCWDWYEIYPSGSETNYRGGSGSYRITRGGNWSGSAIGLQVGKRYSIKPYSEYNYLGFRIARSY